MSNGFDPNPERLQAIMAAFVAARPGQTPANITELLPYATTAEQKTALQKAIILKNYGKNRGSLPQERFDPLTKPEFFPPPSIPISNV